MNVAPALPRGIERIAEADDGSGLHLHPGWADELPWIVQGITGSTADMSLFGGSPAGDVVPRWQQLRDRMLCRTIVHSRQVHRDTVLVHDNVPAGLLLAADSDGHATRQSALLLAVSVADCVPISIAAPEVRAVALLHGGWRGVAAGILERGVDILTSTMGARADDLHVHLGPAICGECFEIGSEVPPALDMAATDITHVDLRARLVERALALGLTAARITVSAFCTRHGDSPFYSHRGGRSERQIAVLGIRAV